MVLVNYVWCDNHLPFAVPELLILQKMTDKNLLIGLPAAASYEHSFGDGLAGVGKNGFVIRVVRNIIATEIF